MKKTVGIFAFLAMAAFPALAQDWEVGGVAGGSFLPGVSVSSPLGSATTGFKTGFTVGAFVSQSVSKHFSGEIRYSYMQSDLKLSSGGSTADFSGNAHLVHYDILYHPAKSLAKAQPFIAFGGGMKIFQGTGTEAAVQPLSQFGYFTKTHEVKPMASVGVGVRMQISKRAYLRAEVRDFITPFPKEVIAPAPGASFGSILHDIVPMVGISYAY
jgi:hypothetical protein